jgi:hypothetical protein
MLTVSAYVEYLIATQRNYTCTHLAAHLSGVSHDQVNRFLANSDLDSSKLQELALPLVAQAEPGFLIVDDSVQDKKYSRFIESAYVQYSGNIHSLTTGINLVNLVHTSGKPGDFLPIDYRIYDPDGDAQTKNDHFRAMFSRAAADPRIRTRTILFDTWYAASENLKAIHRAGWTFFTTLKSNRLASLDRSISPLPKPPHQALDTLEFSAERWQQGVLVWLKMVPFPVLLFKLVAPDGDIEWVITNPGNGLQPLTSETVRYATRTRWHIEEFHRSFKQLTGSERCQCRRAICQQNHLSCCYLAWMTLREFARKTGQTIYRTSQKIWSDYLVSVLKNSPIPSLSN